MMAQADVGVLDQAQPAIDPAAASTLAIGGASQQQIAQVITPGSSGWLTGVGLPVAGSGTLLLRIEDVSGGRPNGIVLTQQSIDGSTLPDFFADPSGFRRLTFDAPLTIAAGDPFALVLSAPGAPTDSFGLRESPAGNLYPSGDGYFHTFSDPAGIWSPLGPGFVDIPFQTFVVAVPEPGTLALLVMAGFSCLLIRGGRVGWKRR
jgi:hypothetical protein